MRRLRSFRIKPGSRLLLRMAGLRCFARCVDSRGFAASKISMFWYFFVVFKLVLVLHIMVMYMRIYHVVFVALIVGFCFFGFSLLCRL
jgi:hypothetical protein